MLQIKIKNKKVEKFLKEHQNAESFIENLILETIKKDNRSNYKNLKILNDLISYNKQHKIKIDPRIDLSELANEVNDVVF